LTTLISGIALYFISFYLSGRIQNICEQSSTYLCSILKHSFLPLGNHVYPALSSIAIQDNNFSEIVVKNSIGALIISLTVYVWVTAGRIFLPAQWIYSIRGFTIHREYINRAGVKGNLINACLNEGRPILITLKNRKVYVGFVIEIPYMADREDWHLKILPLRSGFRNENKLILKLNNDYREIWEKVNDPNNENSFKSDEIYEKLRNVGIVINWDDIEIASEWIPEIYNSFNPED